MVLLHPFLLLALGLLKFENNGSGVVCHDAFLLVKFLPCYR